MRNRTEIEADFPRTNDESYTTSENSILQTELLLDIRDQNAQIIKLLTDINNTATTVRKRPH